MGAIAFGCRGSAAVCSGFAPFLSAFVAALIICAALPVQAGTIDSVATGLWNNRDTWEEGDIPGSGDTGVVNSSHKVTVTAAGQVDADTGARVNANGTLFARDLTDAFLNGTITLTGGTLKYDNNDRSKTVGGNITVAADSTVDVYRGNGNDNDQTTTFGSLNFGPGGHTLQMIDSDTADSGPQLTRFVGSVFTESGTINVTDTGWAELTGLGMAAGVIITKIGPNILRISGDNSGKYAANSRLEVPG